MVYTPECEQQLRNIKNNTRKYEILHTLNLGCSFIVLRELCNNQRPRCDIAWLHVTNHLYHGFPPSINITYTISIQRKTPTCHIVTDKLYFTRL